MVEPLPAHQFEQLIDQSQRHLGIKTDDVIETQLGRHSSQILRAKGLVEQANPLRRSLNQLRIGTWIRSQQGKERLGIPGQIPLRDRGLGTEAIAPHRVYRREHCRRIVRLQESSRPVVDRLARERHVVGVHHAMDEAERHPLRNQPRLCRHHGRQQPQPIALHDLGVVPTTHVISKRHLLHVTRPHPHQLGHADPQMRRGHSGQHRTGQRPRLAPDGLPGGHRRERPRRRHPEGVHRLAQDVFAQHRPDCSSTVTPAREGRPTRTLQRNVPTATFTVDDLAEQVGPPIPQEWTELPELVPGIRLRKGHAARGDRIPRQHGDTLRAPQPLRVQPQLERQCFIDEQQPRHGHGHRVDAYPEPVELEHKGVVEAPVHPAGARHPDIGEAVSVGVVGDHSDRLSDPSRSGSARCATSRGPWLPFAPESRPAWPHRPRPRTPCDG